MTQKSTVEILYTNLNLYKNSKIIGYLNQRYSCVINICFKISLKLIKISSKALKILV